MKYELKLADSVRDVIDGLDGIIEALGGTYPPTPPPNPKTIVTYNDGMVEEYLIKGELGWESIPDKENAVKVEIGTAVTSIGGEAFYDCFGLTSITIPNSVTSIGDSSFSNCSSLTSITIPNSVTSIGSYAFSGCTNLTTITIPDSMSSIENFMFWNCSELTSITISDSVTSFGDGAFQECSSLTSITIPDSVTSIGNYAFYKCLNLSSITCQAITAPTVQQYTFGSNSSSYAGYPTRGSNVLKVPANATGYDTGAWANPLQDASKCGFRDSRKTVVTYQNGVSQEYLIEGELGQNSISNRENADKVEIGTAVTSIGEGAFGGCSGLMSVRISDSVTNIGNYAFASCNELTSIIIPDSVTSIGEGAFGGCYGLTSIIIPDHVTSIGDYAFRNCSGLTSITCLATTAPTINSGTFGNDGTYTGRNSYSTGNNVLKVPQGATGYDSGTWVDPLQDANKCGFHIETI